MSTHHIAEVSVIGSLMKVNQLHDIQDMLIPEDFSDWKLQRAYKAILELRQHSQTSAIDFLSVSEKIKPADGETADEIFVHLAEIANNTFSTANLKHHAHIVKKAANKRKTIAMINEVMNQINNDDDSYIDRLRKGLTAIENDATVGVHSFDEQINNAMTWIDEQASSEGDLTGIGSGFKKLDSFSGGFQKGNLIILGAHSGSGKTTLAINMFKDITLKQKKSAIFFSMEMTARELVQRMLSTQAQVIGDKVFNPKKLSTNDFIKLAEAGIELKNANFKAFINDKCGMSVFLMRQYARSVKSQHGLDAIFVDYLGLMEQEGENATLALGKISRELKILAKDFDIPVIALTQLNRTGANSKDNIKMSEIRQSGHIVHDADVIMFINDDPKEPQKAILDITKNRNGRTGQINLEKKFEYLQFKDYIGY